MRIGACLVVMFLSCGDGRPDAPPTSPHAPTDVNDPPVVVVVPGVPVGADPVEGWPDNMPKLAPKPSALREPHPPQ